MTTLITNLRDDYERHPTRPTSSTFGAAGTRRGTSTTRQPDVAPLDRDIAEPGDPYDAVDHATDVAAFLDRQIRQGRIGPATAVALHPHAVGDHVPEPQGTRAADTIRKRRRRDVRRLRALEGQISHELLAS